MTGHTVGLHFIHSSRNQLFWLNILVLKYFKFGLKIFEIFTYWIIAATPGCSSPVAPLPPEVEDFIFDVGTLLLQHLGRGLVNDLHFSEIPKEVSIEVHIEFTVVVEGQSQLVLLVLADFPPLTVPEDMVRSKNIFFKYFCCWLTRLTRPLSTPWSCREGSWS